MRIGIRYVELLIISKEQILLKHSLSELYKNTSNDSVTILNKMFVEVNRLLR